MPPRSLPFSIPICLFLVILLLLAHLSSHVVSAFLHMSLSSPLQGKVVLVTGASRGIGRGIAFELATAGTLSVAHAPSSFLLFHFHRTAFPSLVSSGLSPSVIFRASFLSRLLSALVSYPSTPSYFYLIALPPPSCCCSPPHI